MYVRGCAKLNLTLAKNGSDRRSGKPSERRTRNFMIITSRTQDRNVFESISHPELFRGIRSALVKRWTIDLAVGVRARRYIMAPRRFCSVKISRSTDTVD